MAGFFLESPSDRCLKDKISLFANNAIWVMKVAWGISPLIVSGVIILELIISAVPASLAWSGRCLINAVAAEIGKADYKFYNVMFWLSICLSLALSNEIFSVLSKFFHRWLNEKLSLKIELDLLNHSAALDVASLEDPDFQDVAMRAKQNSSGYVTGFLNNVITLCSTLCKIIGLVFILFWIDPIVVMVITPLVIPFMLFKWSQSKARFNKEYTRATKRRWTNYYSNLLTNRLMVLEVKLLDMAPELIKKFSELKSEFIREDRKIYKREFVGTFLFSSLFAILFYILFARISLNVMENRLTIGDIAIFAGSTRELFNLLSSVATIISGIMEGMLYVENLITFFNRNPEIKNISGVPLTQAKGDIIFNNVWFKYPGSTHYTLKNISFHIKPGETVAIVGKNGAGKSTLVKLIARLYETDNGDIFIDSVNIKEIDQEILRGKIAFVLQQPNRYEASVAENIACGSTLNQVSIQDIKNFAETAGADQMIASFPNQYDTLLGRQFGEHDLSRGQWQKIAIARAVARKNSRILILDEPASGLDVHSRMRMMSHFKDLAATRTTLLISHRLSTLSLADRIIVLENGEVLCLGTHSELLEQSEYYRSMVKLYTNWQTL